MEMPFEGNYTDEFSMQRSVNFANYTPLASCVIICFNGGISIQSCGPEDCQLRPRGAVAAGLPNPHAAKCTWIGRF